MLGSSTGLAGNEGMRLIEDLTGLSGAGRGWIGKAGEVVAISEAILEAIVAAVIVDEVELVEDRVDGFCGIGGADFLENVWSSKACEVVTSLPCCCWCCCFKCVFMSVELLRNGGRGGDVGVGDGVLRSELLRVTAAAALLRAGGMDGFPLVL